MAGLTLNLTLYSLQYVLFPFIFEIAGQKCKPFK